MRKLLVLGLAALLVVAFSVPASAIEHKFGGYWRTRFFGQYDFAGESNANYVDPVTGLPSPLDSEDQDLTRTDTRTRLYYTAVLNENLSLVNKFEFDANWGTGPLGDYGADGVSVEVKQSYALFNWGPTRWAVGIHDSLIARGFIFADEMSGLTVSYRTDTMNLVGEWIKGFEGGAGKDANDFDIDTYGLNPVFTFGEGFSLNPFVYYMYSDDAGLAQPFVPNAGPGFGLSTAGYNNPVLAGSSGPFGGNVVEETSIYWVGANADFTLGPASLWATGIYQGGDIDNDDTLNPGGQDIDVSAYLFAFGASMPLGPVGIHGQFFWASGDEDADDDFEAFFGMGGGGVGWAYYWSEIMGLGIFDAQTPPGTPGGDVSNIWALNVGATLKPIEKLSLKGDIWYAQLVQDAANLNSTIDASGGITNGEDDLGVEIDLVATYQLIEGMNLDIVGAYLFAGDAISTTGSNDDDPYEFGMRLSLSF
jgi:hypothetical protein